MPCYYNGQIMELDEVKLPVLDRGFIFGDGVYEVIAGYQKQMFGGEGHIRRLLRSLGEVGIESPHDAAEWQTLIQSVIDANPWPDQSVYIQVTRGVAKRDHAFPKGVAPTIFVMPSELILPSPSQLQTGVAVVTADDTRWARCDIKSTSLLPTVLLRQNSVKNGAYETVLIRDGMLTEGSGSNIYVVVDGAIVTPPKSNKILAGVTRDIVLALARAQGIRVDERDVPVSELLAADEIWLSASPKEVLPITTLDGRAVGASSHLGKPGPVFQRVWEAYQASKARADKF